MRPKPATEIDRRLVSLYLMKGQKRAGRRILAICVMMKGRFPVDKRMNLLSLTWPIFIENMLFMLLGFIDIFVLSRYNDVAASAVSAANQVISICNLVFSIISGATAILISQSLGAEKRQSASMIAALSLLFSTLIGLIVSALIAVFHRPLLAALGAQGDILEYGCEYLLIVGGFIFTQAILNSVTAILRSHGYTRISMYVTAIMNVLNAILDTAFVLGLFGLPSLGVRGVAIATTLARVIGVAILCFMLFSQVESPSIFALLKPFPREEGKKILLVGLPSAFESINYNVAQLVVTSIIFHFLSDTDFITKTYFSNIVIFFYVFSNSIAQAAQILVGYHMGNGDPESADRVCMHSLKVSLLISMSISIGALFVRQYLMMIFTTDPVIVQAGASLFFIDLFVEFGRTFNIVVINGLRGAGDTVYPSVVAVFSMWIVSTLGCYLLAVPLGLGLPGIWIAFAADECLRGLLMQLRWKSGKWKNKSLYSRAKAS